MNLPPFDRLIDDHGADVHRFLVVSAGRAEADDLFQDVFLAALRSYPRLSHTDNLRGWLFTIAYRAVVDGHRTRRRTPEPREQGPDRAAPDPGSRDEVLWGAVRGLPPKQRTAVAARFVLDLSFRQVGEIVGCSEAAARQNVRAALAALRKEMGP